MTRIVPFTKNREVIYDLMTRAKRFHCPVSTCWEHDVGKLWEARRQVQVGGRQLSMTACFVKATGLLLEKHVRGVTAGFNTPTFVVDTLGGGGKRDGHSYEAYDEENGIAVFSSPTVRPGELFYYFDPIDTLSEEAQIRWVDPATRRQMMEDVKSEARR